jgi:hypothetical protein
MVGRGPFGPQAFANRQPAARLLVHQSSRGAGVTPSGVKDQQESCFMRATSTSPAPESALLRAELVHLAG